MLRMELVTLSLHFGDLTPEADILQLAARCAGRTFSAYVQPTRSISARATAATGLSLDGGGGALLLFGEPVPAVDLRTALLRLAAFLRAHLHPSAGSALIVSHGSSMDAKLFVTAIARQAMFHVFSPLVHAFADSVLVIRERTGRLGRGQCSLAELARWQGVAGLSSCCVERVRVLGEVLQALDIDLEDFWPRRRTFEDEFVRRCRSLAALMV